MKIIKHLAFGALAAVALTLLFQTPITLAGDNGKRGDDNERGDRDHRDGKATFTKWVTSFRNLPGDVATFAGVVGGGVGNGIFTGELLLYSPSPTVSHFVAFYHFTGLKHSFTALVNVEQTGLKAVIIGVVTDGWLKGRAVVGEYTEDTCTHDGITTPCFQGTLEIKRDSKD